MYLTYDEYKNFGGQTLEEAAFQQLEFEARTIIDWWTFNRLQKEESYPEAVKRCVYKLIMLIDEKQKAMTVGSISSDGAVNAGIASESNDGVSVSYNTLNADSAMKVMQNEIGSTINMYLSNVRNSLGHKVLYRGVYPDE